MIAPLEYYKQYYKNIYFVNLLLFAALLPFTNYFSVQFTNIALILLFVSWLFLHSKEGLNELKFNKIILLFLAVYLFCFFNFLKGGDFSIIGKILVKRIPLLIFPLVIGLSPKIQGKNLNAVLITFVISTIAASIVTYFRGVSNFVITPEALTDLAFKIIIHRPYFGLFCAFGILALVFLLSKKNNIFINLVIVASVAYFLFFIVFIYAKMALIGLFITAVFLGLLKLIYHKYYTYLLILVATCIISFVMLYQVNTRVQRYTQAAITNTQNIIQGKGFSYEKYNILIVGSINVRYINWGCAFTILKENNQWIHGVGAGNAQMSLQNCYKDRNPWVYDNKMNAHNQFIQEMLYTGIFGFLLFFSSLIVPFIISFNKNNFLFNAFILIFIFCSLTENILERQIGIFFYAFFNSLLFFNTVEVNTACKNELTLKK